MFRGFHTFTKNVGHFYFAAQSSQAQTTYGKTLHFSGSLFYEFFLNLPLQRLG